MNLFFLSLTVAVESITVFNSGNTNIGYSIDYERLVYYNKYAGLSCILKKLKAMVSV